MFLSSQRYDESEENEEKLIKDKNEESLNGKEKKQKENGNVNGKTTEQPSKKRKEDFSELQVVVKKLSPEKKKVCELFLVLVVFSHQIN